MFNAGSPVWHGNLAWNHLEKILGNALKWIFSLPITKSSIGLIIETGVGPAEQRINYSSLMLYHSIINSIKDRLVKQIIQEQTAQYHQNTFYEKLRTIAEELNTKLEAAVTMEEIRVEKNTER